MVFPRGKLARSHAERPSSVAVLGRLHTDPLPPALILLQEIGASEGSSLSCLGGWGQAHESHTHTHPCPSLFWDIGFVTVGRFSPQRMVDAINRGALCVQRADVSAQLCHGPEHMWHRAATEPGWVALQADGAHTCFGQIALVTD